MARHLTEDQIAEYRECFNLYDKKRNGKILCSDLVSVMRSLGACPTEIDIKNHLKLISKAPGDHMDFSHFLTIMHKQGSSKNINKDILEAFKITDPSNSGTIPVSYLRNILMNTGEALTMKEVEQMFQKGKVSRNQKTVNYKEFISLVSAPIPY
uniref:Calmodulin-like protein 4 n=1 Tax=Phallusia mammillata TaxID=59560 RepID=A0A6F9D8T0_9ASCI|nr:calmodulin-like protein 4 [Phallusia mammillata]